jgi:hypothetical protein
MQDGLTIVINIARGIQGEEALPEEFAHFIIEGMINHPLVQRLLNSLDDIQLQEIFGDSYNRYFEKYNGEMIRMKKEPTEINPLLAVTMNLSWYVSVQASLIN